MIKRLVLDILLPNKISIIDLAKKLSQTDGIEAVNVTVKEIDAETQTLIVVVEGNNIDFDRINSIIEDLGGVIHSIDQVVAGKKLLNLPSEVVEEL
uniref:DUF211 domain-containing protein n=1 Tax=Staphylothermus marinus TaxID=2280 RepID=A0A7C4NR71_STAMA